MSLHCIQTQLLKQYKCQQRAQHDANCYEQNDQFLLQVIKLYEKETPVEYCTLLWAIVYHFQCSSDKSVVVGVR